MRELLLNVRSITRGPASFTSPERLHFTTTSGTAAARMLDRCIAVTLRGCSPVRICCSRRRRRLRRRRALRGVQARAGRRAAFRRVSAVSSTVGAGARVAHPVQRVCSRARGWIFLIRTDGAARHKKHSVNFSFIARARAVRLGLRAWARYGEI